MDIEIEKQFMCFEKKIIDRLARIETQIKQLSAGGAMCSEHDVRIKCVEKSLSFISRACIAMAIAAVSLAVTVWANGY